MKITYEEWNCDGIWGAYGEDQMLCIKNYRGGIIVGIENCDGTIEDSCTYAESEYMEAFSDFLKRGTDNE